MVHQAGLPPELAQVPLRTLRPRDVLIYAHPRTQLARLTENGLLHRLARGFYAVVPQDRVGAAWMPSLEGAAAGIAAAEFGLGGFALMGLSAARVHRVVPRAIGLAVVAAPRRRESLRLTDRSATVQFLVRDLEVMQLEMLSTDVGSCLVTTPEQTVLDLAHLPRLGELEDETQAAIRALLPRCDEGALQEIAEQQRLGRAWDRVRKLAQA